MGSSPKTLYTLKQHKIAFALLVGISLVLTAALVFSLRFEAYPLAVIVGILFTVYLVGPSDAEEYNTLLKVARWLSRH